MCDTAVNVPREDVIDQACWQCRRYAHDLTSHVARRQVRCIVELLAGAAGVCRYDDNRGALFTQRLCLFCNRLCKGCDT